MSERPYQLQARESVKQIFKTEQSALIVMCTGGGKTHVFSHIIKDTPGRVFVMAHRTELIEQAANKIAAITGLDRGRDIQIEKAEQYASRLYPSKVVVGSVQTMARGRYKDFDPLQYKLFVLDECIHGLSRISMVDGTTRTIKQIHDEGVGVFVLSYNAGLREVEPALVVGKKRSKTKSTYHVIFGDGSEIVCTPEHKIYTKHGYVLAKDLTRKDFVLKCVHENTAMDAVSLRKPSWGWQHTENQERLEPAIEVSAQHETSWVIVGEVREAETVCQDASKGKAKRWMGWTNNIICHLNPARVLRSVVNMHQKLQEDAEQEVAGEGYRRGFSLVVYGRWVQAKSWCESMYRRVFLPGAFRYSRMVLLPLGVRGQNATCKAGSMDNTLHQRSSTQILQNHRALYGALCRIQTVQARGGSVRKLQGRLSTSPCVGETNLLQQTRLPYCSRKKQWSAILPEEQGRDTGTEPRSSYGCENRKSMPGVRRTFSYKQKGSGVVPKAGVQESPTEAKVQRLVSCEQRSRVEETIVISIREVEESIDVYDLEVEGNHNYFANGILVSNCHHGVSSTNKMVIEHFAQNPNCKILGTTGTADRADEKSLGMVFKNVAIDYSTVDGIRDGWLVPIEQNEVFVQGLDFSKVKTSMGDLANNELAAIMEFEENLHEVASSTIQIVGNRKTLVFAASVAQAERMSEIFNRHKDGCADFVTGKTAKDVRADMFKNYAMGSFQYLVGVGVMTEGFDDPGVEVIAMARPTKSRSLYAQMAGRSMRPAGEIAYQLNECNTAEERKQMIAQSIKPSALLIDFVGNSGRHKLINSADILGGKYDDDIVELAKAEISRKSKTGESTEVITELAKAERDLARRRHEEIEAAKRSGLKLKAAFSLKGVDPFDVLNIVPMRLPGWDQGREATEAQIKFLKRDNIDAVGMNIKHASQLIGELVERRKGRCQFKKHKDKLWADIDIGYRKWCLRQSWINLTKMKRTKEDILQSLKEGA